MKVGIYSPYLDTLGGGERYALTVAEYFLSHNHRVEIFWDQPLNIEKMTKSFGLNLSGLKLVKNIFSKNSLLTKLKLTASYDLIFFISDGSIPATLAKKNILHFQTPLILKNQDRFLNKVKLKKFQHIVCNSAFTKKFIDQSFGISSEVLYPPVDVDSFHPGKKENIILSVGRFSSQTASNSKKQEVLIAAFKKLTQKGLKNWKLILNGNISPGNNIDSLQKLASQSKNIEITPNVSFEEIVTNYSKAKIYWHAAGFAQDLNNHPERGEHFGITSVEAMASGAVPIVFPGGGQSEVVVDKTSGLYWTTLDELVNKTLTLAKDNSEIERLSKNAIERSKIFSKQKFFEKISLW